VNSDVAAKAANAEASDANALANGRIALIAGEGILPIEIARRLTERSGAPLVLTLRSDVDAFRGIADPLIRMRCPRLSQAIREMKKYGVQSVIMAGRVPKKLIYIPALFDPLTFRYLTRISHDDHSLLAGVVDIIESNGISVLPYWHILPEFLAPEGQLGHRPPTEKETHDVEYGVGVLKVTLSCIP